MKSPFPAKGELLGQKDRSPGLSFKPYSPRLVLGNSFNEFHE